MFDGTLIIKYFISSLVILLFAWLYVKVYVWLGKNFLIPVISYGIFYFDRRYVHKNMEFNVNKKYSAIILASNYWPEKISVYSIDIPKLLKTLKLKKESYKVYEFVSAKEFKKIINNPKVSNVYILGHGQRHGVKLGKNECIYYCEFKNAKKKEAIFQFHCNHYGGKSLADYILSKKGISFVTTKKMNTLQINKIIYENYKKAKKDSRILLLK